MNWWFDMDDIYTEDWNLWEIEADPGLRSRGQSSRSNMQSNYNKKKNARALKIHSVIYWSISINRHRISRKKMPQMYKIPFFSWRIKFDHICSFQTLIHLFQFWQPYLIFEENVYFMDILTIDSHYLHIFM